MTRQYVKVWSTDESDFTMPLAEFVAEMRAVLKQEGENATGLEFRMEFDSGCYDEGGSVDMWVQRPETDAEMQVREAGERERSALYRRQLEAEERARYERLKAKFEGLSHD